MNMRKFYSGLKAACLSAKPKPKQSETDYYVERWVKGYCTDADLIYNLKIEGMSEDEANELMESERVEMALS